MSELKPCPFCGSENVEHYFDTQTEYLSEKHFGHCRKCGANGPNVWRARNGESWDEIHARVVDAWNRRAEVKGDADAD